MTVILGISAYYHDSAAALLIDGRIAAAVQEERFSRLKHDARFPRRAIACCLEMAGLAPEQIDYVGFYEKPLQKFDRLLETYLGFAPSGFRSFFRAMPLWLRQKLHLRRELDRGLGGRYQRRYVFAEHHESHAAAAFFPSPFEQAAILTMDGVGEWATTTWGTGRANRIELTAEQRFPHSLGLLYSAFTLYCGFRVNSGEYKLMGLAPYGRPTRVQTILDELIDLKSDGSFRLNMDYFGYCQSDTMTNRRFHHLFGGAPHPPDAPPTQKQMDLAASIQAVTEECILRTARHVQAETQMKHLCLAGGVALNCVANGRLLREGPFEDIWIQPAAGDAGGALGVALLIWHQLLDRPRHADPSDSMRGALLGPRFGPERIRAYLDTHGAPHQEFADQDALLERVVQLMCAGRVVGFMQGPMEFGPRALGCRSIVGDARSAEMQNVMNLKIKFRESFRPFAPSVLQGRVHEYFQVEQGQQSPYMLLVAKVHPDVARRPSSTEASLSGLDKLRVVRSEVPAITHVDNSARIQTVDAKRHPRYHALIERFAEKTGCPVIINTSFNVRGEPIVCTPEDAYRCFMATDMDALVIENHLLLKRDQPHNDEVSRDRQKADHLARFSPD